MRLFLQGHFRKISIQQKSDKTLIYAALRALKKKFHINGILFYNKADIPRFTIYPLSVITTCLSPVEELFILLCLVLK